MTPVVLLTPAEVVAVVIDANNIKLIRKTNQFCVRKQTFRLSQMCCYSQWGDSSWYTFWRAQPKGYVEDRDTAIFEICDVAEFSARELRNDLNGCALNAASLVRYATTDQVEELKEYMIEFLCDVDAEYPSSITPVRNNLVYG